MTVREEAGVDGTLGTSAFIHFKDSDLLSLISSEGQGSLFSVKTP